MGKEKRTPVHSIDPTLLPGTVNVNPAVFGKVGTEGAGFWSEWCSDCKMGVNLLRDTPRGGHASATSRGLRRLPLPCHRPISRVFGGLTRFAD
jgi:thiol-disulfide isomerase/thioredoxin